MTWTPPTAMVIAATSWRATIIVAAHGSTETS